MLPSVCVVLRGLLDVASEDWEAELWLAVSAPLEVEAGWVAAARLLLILGDVLVSELSEEVEGVSAGGVAKVTSSKWALASRMSDLEYSAEAQSLSYNDFAC